MLISVVILILFYYKCIQIIIKMTFFETAVSIGVLSQITLPTRIGEAGYRSYLIDNIFTCAIDAIEQTIPGTLLPDITDHKTIFTSVKDVQYKEQIPKYKKIEVRDNLFMTNFINELQQMNILYNSLNANLQSNPNNNNFKECKILQK